MARGIIADNQGEWREKVLRRDGYWCRKCGTGEGLEAHHIHSSLQFPSLELNVNNGITLCRQCHVGELRQPQLLRGPEALVRGGKYVPVKLRETAVAILRRCQRPHEPLSDTFMALIDPVRYHDREAEARERDKASAGKGEG